MSVYYHWLQRQFVSQLPLKFQFFLKYKCKKQISVNFNRKIERGSHSEKGADFSVIDPDKPKNTHSNDIQRF